MSETLDDPNTGWTVVSLPPEARPATPAASASPPPDPGGWTVVSVPGAPEAPAESAPDSGGWNVVSVPGAEKQGFIGGALSGLGHAGTEAKQLVTGDGFNPANIETPPERTFMGEVGYGLGHGAPTLASMLLGAMGGGAAGTAIGGPAGTAIGGVLGGAAGGGIVDTIQQLVPGYQAARGRGLPHDEAVNEAWNVAAASGAFTAGTAPLYALKLLKGPLGNLLAHTVVTGPVTGAVKQGVIDPAITGQPTPSADEMLTGAIQNAIGGGIAGGVMHYGPPLGRRLFGLPEPSAALPPAPEPEAPPPGARPYTELFNPTEPPLEPPLVPPEQAPAAVVPPEPLVPPEQPPAGVVPSPEPRPLTPGEPPPDGTLRPLEPPVEPVIQPDPLAPVARPGVEAPAGPDGAVPLAPDPAQRGGAPVPGADPAEPVQRGVDPLPPEPAVRVAPPAEPEPGPLARPEGEQPPAPEPAVEAPPAWRAEHPDIPDTLYRGSGREDQAAAYNPAGGTPVPILGPGRYAAFSEEHAKAYGPNVERTPLDLKNPLVIRSDEEWRALTREAGWKFVNPFGADRAQVERDTQAMRDLVRSKGHDGVVVHWDDSINGDMDRQGRGIKTLRNVFGDPQVVDYREATQPRTAVPVEPPAVTPAPAPAPEPPRGARAAKPPPPETRETTAKQLQPGDVIRTPAGKDLTVASVGTDKTGAVKVQVEGRKTPLAYGPEVPLKVHAAPPVEAPVTLEARSPGPPPVARKPMIPPTVAGGSARPVGLPGKRVKPVPRFAPKIASEPGRPLTLEDYTHTTGTPRYREAFHEAMAGTGDDPRTAMNKPVEEQIKLLSGALKSKYGFEDIRVDPSVDPKITRDQMLNMHQNMQNMAAAHGWSNEAVSLDGRLRLKLVPRDFGGEHWMGQYSGSNRGGEIAISGGSNSYAHEHWHAIDHLLSDRLNKNPNKQALFTWAGREGELDPRHPVQAAFAQVLNAMSHGDGEVLLRRLTLEKTAQQVTRQGTPTQAAARARAQLDMINRGQTGKLRIPKSEFVKSAEAMGGDYYRSVHELFARMGEAYTASRMETQGMDTKGVVKSDAAYRDRTIRYLRDAYPDPFDRARIFATMDRLAFEIERAGVLDKGRTPAVRASEANTLPAHHGTPQVGPGFLSRLREDLGSLRWSRLFGADHDTLVTDHERPPAPPTYDNKQDVAKPRKLPVRAADVVSKLANSALANLERIMRQIPPGARPYIQQIYDKLGVSPGSGRMTLGTFDERSRRYEQGVMAEAEDIFRKNGLTNRAGRVYLTRQEEAMFWHTMTTGETRLPLDQLDVGGHNRTVPIPDKIIAAAEHIRPLMEKAHEYMTKAGLKVGYVRGGGFGPRVFDDYRIMSDQGGFERDMAGLHRRVIDKDIDAQGGDAERVARLHKWYRDNNADTRASLFPARTVTDMDRMTANLKRIEQIDAELAAGGAKNANAHDPTALRAERDTLRRDNKLIHDTHRGTVRDALAQHEAEARFARIAEGKAFDFDTIGPKADFLKGRVLPPETDQIMRHWLLQNPRESLAAYFHGVARKTAYHELFGKNGEEVQNLVKLAMDQGMHGAYKNDIYNIVEAVTGRSLRDKDQASSTVTGLISSLGALISLPGASISALAEPSASLLAGGNARLALGTYTKLMGQMFGTVSGAERMMTLRHIGGVATRLQGAANASRQADYAGTPRIAKLVNGFFELALSPAIRMIRAATVGSGTDHMKLLLRLATDPATTRGQLNRQDDARIMLRDFGVRDENMKMMRSWLERFPDLPDLTAISDSREGQIYDFAMNRLLNRFNQNPTAAEKPLGALKSPWLNMMSQLTAFPYGFWRNVMEPVLHKAAHAKQRQWDRSIAAGASNADARFQAEAARFSSWAQTFVSAAALMAGTALFYAPRTYLLNHNTWKKHEEAGDLGEFLLSNTVSQSGMAGPIDVIVQALTGLRYNADISSITQGPYLSTEVRYLIDIAKAIASKGAGEPGTNTEVYNGIQAMTQLVGKPGILTGLTWLAERVPEGGPLAAALTAFSVLGTSSTATRGFTDMLAGEKGTEIPKPKPPGSIPDMPEMQNPMSELENGDDEAGGMLPTWAVGLADDLLMPALRMTPYRAQMGLAGVGAAAGIGLLLNRGAAFRDEGTPPKKVH